jgi:predicted nucleic acid-binding protein
MLAVSNTSPISNLAVTGNLEVLRRQFGEIVIPEAVRLELEKLDHTLGRRAIERARAEGWIKVLKLKRRDLTNALTTMLDAGEAEAIALALEQAANLLIIDESAGRAMARPLGVLLKEFRLGRIPSMREAMDDLVNEDGFFLSLNVRRKFLEAAGEA